MRHLRRGCVAAVLVLASAAAAGCSSGSSEGAPPATASRSTTTAAPPQPSGPVVFNGQGNNLDAYASEPSADGSFATQRVFETADTDPKNGRDVNAQICFLPRDPETNAQWFVAGEDTNQDDPGGSAGWGIFLLEGGDVGSFKSTELNKLVPTYQPANDNPENYGCGVLSDGRVLTTDVGNQATGSGDGQLIVWFPPLTGDTVDKFIDVPYCKLDVTLPTAQSILVRDDVIYVAAARGGVFEYTGPFPTSPDAAGGCGKKDATGAPMADEIHKKTFIAPGEHGLATPAGLAEAPDGGFYVSSVFTGVINEYGPDGSFRRTILQPAKNDSLGVKPYATGTPLGIGVDSKGTLYYADIGVVVADGNAGPGDHTGTVRRIRFVDGEPQKPEIMATDLDFPDGIGVWEG